MVDVKGPRSGLQASAGRSLPVWKEVIVGRYFGSVEAQVKTLQRAGYRPLSRFADILREARTHREAALTQSRLQLVKVQLKDLGLYHRCTIHDVNQAMYRNDLVAFIYEFATWLWLQHPDALSKKEICYIYSRPTELRGGEYIPKMQQSKTGRFFASTDIHSTYFEPEDTFIAVQWVMEV